MLAGEDFVAAGGDFEDVAVGVGEVEGDAGGFGDGGSGAEAPAVEAMEDGILTAAGGGGAGAGGVERSAEIGGAGPRR